MIPIQPDEAILVRFQAKHPGARCIWSHGNALLLPGSFAAPSPDAYETLLWI